MGRAAVQKPEGASSNPSRANEFFVGGSSVRMKTKQCIGINKKKLNVQPGRNM